jgi:hypothetical protein
MTTDLNSVITAPQSVRCIWRIDSSYNADGKLHSGRIHPGREVHPDLIRYQDHWYCGFKESGRTRIIRSADGEKWQTVKLLEWAGGHVGDLRFSITADGSLMFNTWVGHPPQQTCPPDDRRGEPRISSLTWLTRDGLDWGHPHGCVTGIGICRYHTTWHAGIGYSFGYMGTDVGGSLYRTLDGKQWQKIGTDLFPKQRVDGIDPHDGGDPNIVARGCNETVLAFEPDGSAIAMVRAPRAFAFIGRAHPPRYDAWQWRAVSVDWDGDGHFAPPGQRLGTDLAQLGGPMLHRLSDGRLIAAGRVDSSAELGRPEARVTLFELDAANARLTRLAAFTGYGQYSGLVEFNNQLWISCANATQRDAYDVYLLTAAIPTMRKA